MGPRRHADREAGYWPATLDSSRPTRRTVLQGAGAAGLAWVGWQAAGTAPAAATSTDERGRGTPAAAPVTTEPLPLGANGWPMLDGLEPQLLGDLVQHRSVPGTGLTVALCVGAPAALLLYVVRRYHYEIARLDLGPLDLPQVTGFRPRRTDRPTASESNHASGTAVDIRSDWHPAGTTGGYTDRELTVVRDILAECGGTVRWGGDSDLDPDESRFEVGVGPEDPRLLDAVTSLAEREESGGGPGSSADLDAFRADRVARARELRERHQRTADDQARAWRQRVA